MALKRFHVVNSFIFSWNTIDTDTLKYSDGHDPTFRRECIIIGAADGVTAQDIVDEVNKIDERFERYEAEGRVTIYKNPMLISTATVAPDFVLCLGYQDFLRLAMDSKINKGLIRRERIALLAQELIQNRDQRKEFPYDGKFFYLLDNTDPTKPPVLDGPRDDIRYAVPSYKTKIEPALEDEYKYVQLLNGTIVQAFKSSQVLVTDRKL